MRVLQVIDSLRIGGAQKLTLTFMDEARKQGVDVTIVSLSEFKNGMALAKPLEEKGAKVLLFSGEKLFSLNRLREFTRFVREGNFSVIHTHLTYANIIGGIAGRLTGTPVVTSLHSTAVGQHANFLRDTIENIMLRTTTRLIGVGQKVADVYKDMLNRDVVVLPNAVAENVALSADERAALRTQIGLDTEQPTLVTVGRLSVDKGVDDLLDAFAQICQTVPNAALLIVGDGILREELEARSQTLSLDENVFWLGMRDDVPNLLSISNIYISASRREGLPLSVLEAMMAALPMVVTAVGDVPKLVGDDAGLLVAHSQPNELAQAALNVLAMPEYGKALGNAGLARVRAEYGAEQWFMRLMKIYTEITPLAREQANVQ